MCDKNTVSIDLGSMSMRLILPSRIFPSPPVSNKIVCSVPSITQENPQLVVRWVAKGMLLKITVSLRTGNIVCVFPPKPELLVNKLTNITTSFVKRAFCIMHQFNPRLPETMNNLCSPCSFYLRIFALEPVLLYDRVLFRGRHIHRLSSHPIRNSDSFVQRQPVV